MQLYVAEGMDVNLDTLELMYVYIDSYKVFQKTEFCLHPAYEAKSSFDDEKMTVFFSEKKNFINLFEEENVNVKIICGKNGCGKTTLLDLIENYTPDNCLYLFKDASGKFASSKRINICIDDVLYRLSETSKREYRMFYACTSHKKMNIPEFSLERNIVDYYIDEKDAFDKILPDLNPLFTHFSVVINRDFFSHFEDIVRSKFKEYDFVYLKRQIDIDPLLTIVISCLNDVSYSSLLDHWSKCKSTLLKLIYGKVKYGKNSELYAKILKDLKIFLNQEYPLKERNRIRKNIISVSQKIGILMERAFGESVHSAENIAGYFNLYGFSKIGEKNVV